MPYGKRDHVEKLLRELESKWYKLPMYKDGNKVKELWLEPQIRLLPFGIVEYIFPRESLDMVLSTLIVEENRYSIPSTVLRVIRKMLKLKKIPSFDNKQKMLSCLDSGSISVNIIPLGIREDTDIVGTKEDDLGLTHEAI